MSDWFYPHLINEGSQGLEKSSSRSMQPACGRPGAGDWRVPKQMPPQDEGSHCPASRSAGYWQFTPSSSPRIMLSSAQGSHLRQSPVLSLVTAHTAVLVDTKCKGMALLSQFRAALRGHPSSKAPCAISRGPCCSCTTLTSPSTQPSLPRPPRGCSQEQGP